MSDGISHSTAAGSSQTRTSQSTIGTSSKGKRKSVGGSESSKSVETVVPGHVEDDGEDENDEEVGEEDHEDDEGGDQSAGPSTGTSKRRRGSASSSRPSGTLQKKKKKTLTPGIVYISRVPPGMTPQKVRHLMARWGEVGKVYAQAKDAATGYNPNHAQQQKKKKRHQAANFSEAWVEFLDKNIAKTVARMLNAEVIGGKKGDRWRDDIWTMKYLSGFRWEMLGEQVAYERQAHQARLRTEIARSKTEQSEYLRNVEVARVLRKRAAKKAEQAAAAPGAAPAAPAKSSTAASTGEPARERFRQRPKAAHQGLEAKGMETVLSSVFG